MEALFFNYSSQEAVQPKPFPKLKIEKELLVIVFACEKFDICILGVMLSTWKETKSPWRRFSKRVSVTHAPVSLQRILLRLQRYNLEVRYKKGPLIYIADTLSPAYLNEMASCGEVKSHSVTTATD